MYRIIFLLALAVIPQVSDAQVNIGDTNSVYTGNWRTTDDIVSGWDWTMPPSAKPASKSGIFTINNSAYPAGWPGNKIRVINAKWKDLEPTPGNYNFSSITNYLNDSNYDGIFLNVRGFVTSIPAYPSEVSAPTWLTGPTYTTNGTTPITSLIAYDPNVKAKHLALITALKNSGILTSPRIWGQIIHLPSSTRGEEFQTAQGNETASIAAAKEYITAWATAAGPNAKKLMWTDDRGSWPDIWTVAVKDGGTGSRGGAIESWLWGQYTPGKTLYTLQTWNNGYLGVNESDPQLTGQRGWHDQNEAYRVASDPTTPVVQQNWRMASLRTLQMRRNIIWVDDSYRMNPQMSKWMSLEAGHDVSSASDAWVSLMRTWTRSPTNDTGWIDREVKNFERWLYQRDVTGAQTTPVINKEHGRNMSISDALDPSLWNIDLARQGNVVGIAVDDRFISDGTNNVAIKVTYVDSKQNPWSLSYTKSNGTVGTRTIQRSGSGAVKTATFFLNDFSASATGTNFDFKLLSPTSDTPFMFVRVIKLVSTTTTPTPTTCTNTLTSSTAIPTGYGASYNPLTSAREYLIQASCTTGTQATVTVGNGNSTTYVYNRGYYYSGTTWTPYTLTCASGALIGGAWCPGRATASIPLPQNPQNVIAYTCQYTNSTWKCGCRDSACTSAYWQLQRVGR